MGHGLKVTQVQGGGTAVRLKSVSGGVSIEAEGMPVNPVATTTPVTEDRVAPIPTTPPIPLMPSTPASTPETLSTSEILQRIERGEMTVDEALKLMKDQS
jgi:hypothetical protein